MLMASAVDITRVELARERITDLVLCGNWPPDAKIQIAPLAKLTGQSATVIREALSQLVGEHLLVSQTNRGFFTPKLRFAEIADISVYREQIEATALRTSMERGGPAWQHAVLAAQHRLSHIAMQGLSNSSIEWTHTHRSFHDTLISACGVPIMRTTAQTLSNLTALFCCWYVPDLRNPERDILDEHRRLARAVLAGDVALACQLLAAEYRDTLADIEAELGHGSGSSDGRP